ncbi:hypothetical protein THAOC_06245 [Thalassiosira oceanica]|uniref:Nuclear migration protein nudC n=1 Tax=Thalassiosira oceanica TaxID=159749 RepID=K0TFB3_THAOC|nr:hypothetical protein THAOC_06245 [Thalassiosira oceanica]|mmetsp:Transcript_26783/g.63515  ORF Transcript_26783/g.63515 Transcript_26783/m.63515 type:complete len:356 (+) Transcript_26783:183-1250(+)|eukprot:EJK72236.1 hypothetical protein THAOC_06245 [Thalassiosira oceanica]
MSRPDFTNDERFDGLYMQVANQTQGIEPLLDTVFSFLRRKSDFFSGPPGSEPGKGTEIAVGKVNEVLKKHLDMYSKDQRKKDEARVKREVERRKKELERQKAREAQLEKEKAKEAQQEGVIEASADGGFDISSSAAEPAVSPEETKSNDSGEQQSDPVTSAEEEQKADPNNDDDQEDDDDNSPPPVGNGGTVEGKYVWTQTLQELVVNVPLPDNTRGRDLNVTMKKKHLKISLRGQSEPIVDAPLTKAIIVDDSFWTVEDGNRLVLTLQKLGDMEWWECPCEGDPKIKLQRIQPENSNLSDLDGETRQTVEKMMYDQRQKAMGLPTADEQKKFDILEKFKRQHPEMDFSNCKVNM